MRVTISQPYRFAAWVSLFAPIIGASLGNAAGGRESAKCGLLMALGVVVATWVGAGLTVMIKRHIAEGRRMRAALSEVSRMRPSKPGVAGLLMTAVFLLASAPFVLAATAWASQAKTGIEMTSLVIGVGFFMTIALSAQWLAWRRLSIYLHEYSAWRDWRKPSNREAR